MYRPRRVLVVAHRTAASRELSDRLAELHAEEPCRFTLLMPAVIHGLHRVVDPEDQPLTETRTRLEAGLAALRMRLPDARVDGMIGSHDPLAAVEDAVNAGDYDAVVISTLPARLSRWLHIDLPRKVADLGLPVTTVTPEAPASLGNRVRPRA
jgi:hypothetical protein